MLPLLDLDSTILHIKKPLAISGSIILNISSQVGDHNHYYQCGLGRGTSRLVISKARFGRLVDQPKLASIILSVIGTAID